MHDTQESKNGSYQGNKELMSDQEFWGNMSITSREHLILQLKQINEQAASVSALIGEFKSMAEDREIARADVVSHMCTVSQTPASSERSNKVKSEKEAPPEPLTSYAHPDKPDETWTSKAIVRRVPIWLTELHEATGRLYSAFRV